MGAGAGVVVLVLLKLFGAGSYYEEQASPESILAQAEVEYSKGELNRALDTCQLAELRNAGEDTMKRIVDLRERVKKAKARQQDQEKLDAARQVLDAMKVFQTKHLATAESKPAARELVRNAKQWQKGYGEVVARYPDLASDATVVQGFIDRFSPAAHLELPDDATDVLFAVDSRLALAKPLYTEALTLIDGYLTAHPKDPQAVELQNRRKAVIDAARADFDAHEAEARKLIAAGKFEEARKEVQAMREASVMTAMTIGASNLEREIARASK